MSARRFVTDHHGQGDVNDRITIEATGALVDRGGGDNEYIVDAGDRISALVFHVARPGDDRPNGLTNEALLAIVIDRLRSYETGPLACAENVDALFYLEQALIALRRRTAARRAQDVEGTMDKHAEPAPRAAGRLTLDGNTLAIDGQPREVVRLFKASELRTGWGAWQALESPLRRLRPPLTAEEWDLLGALPETDAAGRGLLELSSALGRAKNP